MLTHRFVDLLLTKLSSHLEHVPDLNLEPRLGAMFPRALPDVLGEQLGGVFSDMQSDDGGFDTLNEDFDQLREDGMSFGSMSDADSCQENPESPEKFFFEFTDLVRFANASVASWRAANIFVAWAGSMQLNGDYRVQNLEEDERVFHSDEVAALKQLAVASAVSWQVADILATQMCMKCGPKENGLHCL